MSEGNTEDNNASNESSITKSNDFIREELVSTAVHFLLNPKVINTSIANKREFLLKKGLTNKEIDIAFDRTILHNSIASSQETAHTKPVNDISFWSQTRAVIPPLALISAFCYGSYYIYKNYIEPKLFGPQNTNDQVKAQLEKLSFSIESLEKTLHCVEANLKTNLETTLYQQSRPTASEVAAINDLKSEISSIKSLLLSKNQFPAPPPPSNSIPYWQMDKSEISENHDSKKENLSYVTEA